MTLRREPDEFADVVEPDGARRINLGHGRSAVVDADLYDALNQHLWYWAVAGRAKDSGYATRGCGGRLVRLHRVVLGAQDGVPVDHIDRDTLNNRRSNLRVASNRLNMANRDYPVGASGYRGIRQSKRGGWAARVRMWGKAVYVAQFSDPKDAALAFDIAARRLYGDFATVNFPTVSIGSFVDSGLPIFGGAARAAAIDSKIDGLLLQTGDAHLITAEAPE